MGEARGPLDGLLAILYLGLANLVGAVIYCIIANIAHRLRRGKRP